ncbi:hypothetical protein [Companilactobacillus zhachilii]|uniref:hypothetical protein n=1 Tax=Companilactobacillus zhachilii TaxID=2304606 RepID=UPI0040339ACA
MINFIGECLAMLFIALIGIITIINFNSYQKATTLIKLSGIINILSFLTLIITIIFLNNHAPIITTFLLVATWIAAILHGYGQRKINWSHHIARALIIIVLIVLMFEPWI